MLVQLPNGLLDGSDLFNYAEIDELRGKQQNYLADRELVLGNIGHVPKILGDLVLSLQTKEGLKWEGNMAEAIDSKLTAGDIETLLIKIREHSFGGRYYFEVECPHCQHMNKDLRVDLDTLELDILTVEEMTDKKRLTKKLPKSKQEVEMRPLYLKDIFEALKIMKNKQNQLVTSVSALSIKRLGTKTKVTPQDMEELPAMDFQTLKKELEKTKLEGTIDTTVTTNCAKCEKEFENKLDVFGSDFFDPSRGSTSTQS